MIISFHLYLLSFAFNRAIHCFENTDDFAALRAAADWALPLAHALQEVAALVLQGFRGLDPRADNIPIADFETRLSIIQRLLLQSTHAFFEDSHLFNAIEVIENDALVTPHDDDFSSLVRVGPADMNMTNDVSRVTERNKSNIMTAIPQNLAAYRADPLRHAVQQIVKNGNVVRRQVPERIHIVTDRTEVCSAGVEVINSALARLHVLFHLLDAGIEYESVTNHQHGRF